MYWTIYLKILAHYECYLRMLLYELTLSVHHYLKLSSTNDYLNLGIGRQTRIEYVTGICVLCKNHERFACCSINYLYLSQKETPHRNTSFHKMLFENECIVNGKETGMSKHCANTSFYPKQSFNFFYKLLEVFLLV